mgnify:CR=1 FL=1
MSKRFLIIGANSDVAQACIPLFEARNITVILGSHKPYELPETKHEIVEMDVTKPSEAIATMDQLDFDGVLYTAGTLPDNETALYETEAENTISVNYTGAVRILGAIAKKFKAQKSGTIVGVSSVGAVRGKTSNIVYGSAKSGFDNFLSGLRQYLYSDGVRVLTIRPGFIRTKMTSGMDLPNRLTASPEQVAKVIVKNALSGNRNIIYVKPIWRPISWILKNIPESIFKRKTL